MANSAILARDFFKRDDCLKEYKLGDELGRGSFAIVRRAICRKTGQEFAVKCIDKAKLQREDEEALATEVAILERVDHPNIVQLVQCFDTPSMFYMVMEVMSGGEMFERIIEKSKFSEEEAANVIRKIASALSYCHARGIVHRDLKPENLLFKDPTDTADIKIADFGLAKLLRGTDHMVTACGTPGYVAPEVIEGRLYTDAVDCWSLGVILYILLCGFPPFYDENNAVLFAQIRAGAYDFPAPYWDDISAEARDLIDRLLVVDPSRRYTAANVLAHPWVSGAASSTPLNVGDQLKKYNARRQFRQGVRRAQAVLAFARLTKGKGGGAGAAVAAPVPAPVEGEPVAAPVPAPVAVPAVAVVTAASVVVAAPTA